MHVHPRLPWHKHDSLIFCVCFCWLIVGLYCSFFLVDWFCAWLLLKSWPALLFIVFHYTRCVSPGVIMGPLLFCICIVFFTGRAWFLAYTQTRTHTYRHIYATTQPCSCTYLHENTYVHTVTQIFLLSSAFPSDLALVVYIFGKI